MWTVELVGLPVNSPRRKMNFFWRSSVRLSCLRKKTTPRSLTLFGYHDLVDVALVTGKTLTGDCEITQQFIRIGSVEDILNDPCSEVLSSNRRSQIVEFKSSIQDSTLLQGRCVSALGDIGIFGGMRINWEISAGSHGDGSIV